MKIRVGLLVVALLVTAWGATAQQAAAPADAQKMAEMGTVVNPVSGALKSVLPRFSKNMVAAAGFSIPHPRGSTTFPGTSSAVECHAAAAFAPCLPIC